MRPALDLAGSGPEADIESVRPADRRKIWRLILRPAGSGYAPGGNATLNQPDRQAIRNGAFSTTNRACSPWENVLFVGHIEQRSKFKSSEAPSALKLSPICSVYDARRSKEEIEA